MLIGFLMRLYRRLLAKSEGKTEDDGYLSWQGEWHAAAWGLSVGALAALTGNMYILGLGVGWVFTAARGRETPKFVPYKRQLTKESLYMIAHAVFGYGVVEVLGVVF